MARQVRHRLTAVALGGLLMGAPLLTSGTANAAQGGGATVAFTGDALLPFTCNSQPTVGAMTVAADSTVRVLNRTGQDAELRLAGAWAGTVPEGGTAAVIFHRTTTLQLNPSCPSAKQSPPVLVTTTDPSVTPPPSGTTDAPTGAAGSSPPSQSGGSPSSDGRPSGSQQPSSSRPATGGVNTGTGGARGGVSSGGHSTTRRTPAAPDSRVPTPTAAGSSVAGATGGSATTRNSTMSATGGGAPVEVPAAAETSTPTDAASASAGGANSTGPGSPAPVDAGPEGASLAEPVATAGSVADNRAGGLLAAVALVCVFGVATGLIRSFVSLRSRSTFSH
ncbi:hypothetical protein [Mangrovihabitans endophyticus]|uniref:Uncharacterized protein n=1 Tax=Mangrovihabitans endophyticus TaxID=1751298 RepID=A0A8J3FP85_9ACTN|nr:hypothetical protein [Mangrovihabitans endophyticus]GGK93502.1 hypothetical protein GCM10012284_29300 [Mangrovihabitans endophyticus]